MRKDYIDMTFVRLKLIGVLRKDIERIARKIKKPRKYFEIKKIVHNFIRTSRFLLIDSLLHIAADHIQYRNMGLPKDILKASYGLGLVKNQLLMDIIADIYRYEWHIYKELEIRIYNKLPEYCRVMIETIELWINDLEHKIEEENKRQKP